MKNILPYITGVTAVLLWGAWFPITRYSVISSLGATDTIFFAIYGGLSDCNSASFSLRV